MKEKKRKSDERKQFLFIYFIIEKKYARIEFSSHT